MKQILRFCLLLLSLFSLGFADIVLYSSQKCPYCRDVDKYLKDNHKSVKTKIIDDNQDLKNELKAKGGKVQVPCLIIDNYALYGSVDIIRWMKTHPERLQDES